MHAYLDESTNRPLTAVIESELLLEVMDPLLDKGTTVVSHPLPTHPPTIDPNCTFNTP